MDGAAFCPACGAQQGAAVQSQEQPAADNSQAVAYAQADAAEYEEAYSQPGLPEGQDLLDGLGTVRNYLQAIADRMGSFFNNESQIASNNAVLSRKLVPRLKQVAQVDTKADTALCRSFAIAMATAFLAFSLGLNSGSMLAGLLLMVLNIWAFSKQKQKVLYVAAVVGIAFGLYGVIGVITDASSSIQANLALSFSMFLWSVIFGLVSFFFAKRKAKKAIAKQNAQIDAQNQQIIAHDLQVDAQNALVPSDERRKQLANQNQQLVATNQALAQEAAVLKNEMYDLAGGWYPWGNEGEYYVLDVVDAFMTIVRNHEADTVKEMMRVYKQDKYRVNVLNSQDVISSQINESLQNQQTMIGNQQTQIRLQRQGNAIAMANCMANMRTASNTDAIRNDVGHIKDNTDQIKDDVRQIRDTPRSTTVVNNDNRVANVTVRR